MDSYQSHSVPSSYSEWRAECVSARWTLKCTGIIYFIFKTAGCDHNPNAVCLGKAGRTVGYFLSVFYDCFLSDWTIWPQRNLGYKPKHTTWHQPSFMSALTINSLWLTMFWSKVPDTVGTLSKAIQMNASMSHLAIKCSWFCCMTATFYILYSFLCYVVHVFFTQF